MFVSVTKGNIKDKPPLAADERINALHDEMVQLQDTDPSVETCRTSAKA